MVVEWSPEDEDDLENIFGYYSNVAGEKTATKIVNRIFESAESLGRMPLSGSVEWFLADLPQDTGG
jgi:plasmid stabilization system protein ParE